MKQYLGFIITGILLIIFGLSFVVLDADYYNVMKTHDDLYADYTPALKCEEILYVYKDNIQGDKRVTIHCKNISEEREEPHFLINGVIVNDEVTINRIHEEYNFDIGDAETPYEQYMNTLNEENIIFTWTNYNAISIVRYISILSATFAAMISTVSFVQKKGISNETV